MWYANGALESQPALVKRHELPLSPFTLLWELQADRHLDEVGIYYAAFKFTALQRAPRSSNLISMEGEVTCAGTRSKLHSVGGLLWKLHTQRLQMYSKAYFFSS